ncbi:DUF5330 domain-containing protein [Bosea sp. 117]|uniref:DUF5330 domain-containing protein n=1 Tax=Bosea sp. 117 TaxID=1125973 RepID=UPI000493BB29|nr:DUF5330 domain-containing protein [Bosea sp. 117]
MLFLLRTAFWLTIVMVLLPALPRTGAISQGETSARADAASHGGPADMGPLEAISAAGAAVSDASGFCGRQPQACAVGVQMLETLGERAGASLQMALEYLGHQIRAEKRRIAERAVAGSSGEDTLTAADLGPAWQGLPAGAAEAGRPAQHGVPVSDNKPVPLPPRRPA